MSDKIAARLRTYWPVLVAYIAAHVLDIGAPVVTWINTTFGLEVRPALVEGVISFALVALTYEAGRWLEKRTGNGLPSKLARMLGKALLSLGLRTGQPVYVEPDQAVQVDGATRASR